MAQAYSSSNGTQQLDYIASRVCHWLGGRIWYVAQLPTGPSCYGWTEKINEALVLTPWQAGRYRGFMRRLGETPILTQVYKDV